MRLAIPLFGDEVAPRFCFASEVLVAQKREDGAWSAKRHLLGELPWTERLRRLAEMDVEILLCGGFNRRYLPLAEELGLKVIWGLRGEAMKLMQDYEQGRLLAAPAMPQEGHARGLWGTQPQGRRRRRRA